MTEALTKAQEPVWPDFVAPPMYENAAPGWTDPSLPDFRLIWQVAKEHGYAVGLHGSMKRDCDLIAAAWTERAKPAATLIAALCEALNAREVGIREPKPNCRIAVNIQVDGWVKLIDLSIVPPLDDPEEAYEIGKRDGYEDAIQTLDVATGGDGEFKGSTVPGEAVDVPVMQQRIIERFTAGRAALATKEPNHD